MKRRQSSDVSESLVRARLCPVCDRPLVGFELEGVEVESCATCRGVWLDAGELEAICAGLEGHAPERLREALVEAREGKRPGRRRCPRCHRRLRPLRLPGDPGVVVDRCPRGHGFWLDRGELEILAVNYREGHVGTVAKFLGELFRHELQVQSKEVRNE